MCWPKMLEIGSTELEYWHVVVNYFEKNPVFLQLLNVMTASRSIGLSVITALVLCIIYIYFMSIFAEYLAWGIIILTELCFIFLAGGGFYYYTAGDVDANTKSTALIIGLVFALVAVIFSVCIWCGWTSLKLAIEMVNASADFLAQTKRVFIVPFLYYIFLSLFFIFWIACVVSVNCMGKITPDPGSPSSYIPFLKELTWGDRKQSGKEANYLIAFLTFGLIWFTFFLTASSNYIIMVTATTYYFTSKGDENIDGSGQVKTGFRWAWVHNFGSLAYGSLLIAIIWTIRVVVYYLFKKLETVGGDNGVIKCISCCVQCFLKCL